MKARLRLRIVLIVVACVAIVAMAWVGGSYAIREQDQKGCPLCDTSQAANGNRLGIYDITNNVLQVLILTQENHQNDDGQSVYTSVLSGAFSGSIENGVARGLVRESSRPDAKNLARLCEACRQKLLAAAEKDVVLVDLSLQKAYPVCGNLDYDIEPYHITAKQEPDGKTLVCITKQAQQNGISA